MDNGDQFVGHQTKPVVSTVEVDRAGVVDDSNQGGKGQDGEALEVGILDGDGRSVVAPLQGDVMLRKEGDVGVFLGAGSSELEASRLERSMPSVLT
ncbi:hypothetical protein ACOSQ4_029407 [Xanthoceras sorbifolium]